MEDMVYDEKSLSAALDRINAGMAAVGGEGVAATGKPCEICAAYKKVRPEIDTAIKLLNHAPFGIGKKVAVTLEKLEKGLDSVCSMCP